jgi:hypothetical protein
MDDESLRTVTPDHKITPKEEKKNRTVRGGDFGYQTTLFVLYTA